MGRGNISKEIFSQCGERHKCLIHRIRLIHPDAIKRSKGYGNTFLDLPETMKMFTSNMIFVKNFTQSDFQAKNFTPVKCRTCDLFKTYERNLINIINLGIIWYDMNLFREKKRKLIFLC